MENTTQPQNQEGRSQWPNVCQKICKIASFTIIGYLIIMSIITIIIVAVCVPMVTKSGTGFIQGVFDKANTRHKRMEDEGHITEKTTDLNTEKIFNENIKANEAIIKNFHENHLERMRKQQEMLPRSYGIDVIEFFNNREKKRREQQEKTA